MDINLLGPLRVEARGCSTAITAHKPRAMLATLLLNDSKVVPATVLTRELWARNPPKSALTTLQTYVLQLRKLLSSVTGLSLAEVAATLLQRRANGYLFQAPPGSVDVVEYERFERAGEQAMADGDLPLALETVSAGLRLWRGNALADVSGGRLIDSEKARLEQSRQTMLAYRFELGLRLGRHQEILGDLASQVRHYPYHEELTAQFIIALYRSGRRDYALGHFRKMRDTMIDELGLEPTSRLDKLANAVVHRAPELSRMPVIALPRSAAHRSVPALVGTW